MFGLIGLDTDKKFSLQDLAIECSVYNHLVTISGEFRYQNATGVNTDALFAFPQDGDWVANYFQAVVGGRIIEGKFKDVDEAKKFHKAAVDSGQREVVIETRHDAPDTFKYCVGNIPSGTEAKITIKFIGELKLSATKSEFENVDRFILSLPMIMRPRYSAVAAAADDGMYHVTNQFTYKFKASFHGTKEIKNVVSQDNKVRLSYTNDKKTNGQVVLESNYDGSKEFTLTIDYLKINDPSVMYIAGTDQNDKGSFCRTDLAVISFIPQFESKRMEIIFMVDRSDSMAGADMNQAKKCVLYFLRNLPTNCMFQIYGYGSYFDKAFMRPESYSDDAIKTGMEYHKKMTADLELTDYMKPLKNLFSYPLTDGYERVVFLLTDGDVSDRDEVVDLVKTNCALTRFYCIGLGSGVSGAFLRKVAAAGNGESTVVKTSQALPGKFTELFDKVVKANPFTVNSVDWQCPNNVTVDLFPDKPEPISGNQFLRLYCSVKNMKNGDKIRGSLFTTYNGQPQTIPIELNSGEGITDKDFTAHHFLAKEHISQIMEQAQSGDVEARKNLIKLSTEANIATKYTKLVAVDKAAPNKGLLVPDKMDPLLYYKPLFRTENFTKKANKTNAGSGDSAPPVQTQIWIRTEVKEATHGNIVLLIADKQNVDGSWDYDPQLIWRLGLEQKDVDESQPEFISKSVWMTMLVYEFLATKLNALEKEWKLLGKKAKEHVCITIKESNVADKLQYSDTYVGPRDIVGFIQQLITKALRVLNAVPTPLSQITAAEIEGASSFEMAERRKYEIVFVIDRSGSMQGVKIESSKQCLYIFLKSLPYNCKFQIYGFGSNFDKAFPQYQDYNDDSIQLGLAYQYKIDASFGGTELLNPLRDLYSSPLVNEYTRLVFILTDGQISNENQAVELVRQYNSLNKVYAIGVGKDVSRTLVTRLAEAGKGKADFVDENSSFSAIVIDLLNEALFADN